MRLLISLVKFCIPMVATSPSKVRPMVIRDHTIAFICFVLTFVVWSQPITMFETSYEGIDNDLVAWDCPKPITNPSPAAVDLDKLRIKISASKPGDIIESWHPQCKALNRTQVVLGFLSLAGAIWKTIIWRRSTSDKRAEKKFAKLHSQTSGRPKGLLS